jgi:hypothetical protein
VKSIENTKAELAEISENVFKKKLQARILRGKQREFEV